MKRNGIIFFVAVMAMIVAQVALVSANPSIKLSVSNYNPLPVRPGQNVDVWVLVQNVGSETARGINIEFVESDYFKLVSSSDKIKTISVLGSQNDYILKYTFAVSNSVPDGINSLEFKYTVDNLVGTSFQSKLDLQVKSSGAPLSISRVSLEPNPLVPGSKSKLSLMLKNIAGATALKDVNVKLELAPIASSTGVLLDYPFVPVGSSNQKTIDSIRAGQTAEVSFELAAYASATAQIYKLPVTITYKDDSGNEFEQSVIVGLEVNADPEILITIEAANLNKKVRTGEIIFDVTNRGLSDIKLVTFYVGESDTFELLSASAQSYIGNVDSDDFETARFEFKANADELEIPVRIEYRDTLNNRFTKESILKFSLKEPSNGNGGGTGTIIIVLLIIVGIGIFFWRRSKKKKQK